MCNMLNSDKELNETIHEQIRNYKIHFKSKFKLASDFFKTKQARVVSIQAVMQA